jgi:hypothetical protein
MADLNEKLIECVLDHIETHPDEYNQNLWAHIEDQHQDGTYCGTAGCFAGWACLLSTPVESWVDKFVRFLKFQGDPVPKGMDNSKYIQATATEKLGLRDTEASHLFDGASGNPKADIPLIKQRLNNIRRSRGLAEVDYAARDAARAKAKAAGGNK